MPLPAQPNRQDAPAEPLRCVDGRGPTAVYETYDRWKDWDDAAFLSCSPRQAAYFAGELAGHPLKDSHVLEIGFGNGEFLGFARGLGAHVYGTEVQPALVERARQAGIATLEADLADADRKLARPVDLVVAFDVLEGGVLCRSCRTGAPISADALDVTRMILGGRLNEALDLPAGPVTHEVAGHANRALEHHLERRLRTVAMFEAH